MSITANQEYIIISFEDERIRLAVDIGTVSQPIIFKHVPVITDHANIKWKLVRGKQNRLCIQLYGQDVFVAVDLESDSSSSQTASQGTGEQEAGVFLTDRSHIGSATEWDYGINVVDTIYKIKAQNGVFTSNGFMNQVTVTTDKNLKSQLWYFQPVGRYESYGDFFQQDTLNADEKGVGSAYPRFGLNLQYQWQSFWKSIADLNKDDESADYKLFFLERHGEAFNNVPNKYLKSEMRDPQLVLEGFLQAQHVQSVWASELAAGIGLPQLSYCSPLTRTLVTNTITFGNLPGISPLVTTIVENCREQVSTGKSEHRHRQKYIDEILPSLDNEKMLLSPNIVFEPGFADHDPYWTDDSDDSDSDDSDDNDPNPGPGSYANPELDGTFHDRVLGVLDEIFGHKDATFVHITTHAGWIREFCRILGRAPYDTINAVVLPIVVKANYNK